MSHNFETFDFCSVLLKISKCNSIFLQRFYTRWAIASGVQSVRHHAAAVALESDGKQKARRATEQRRHSQRNYAHEPIGPSQRRQASRRRRTRLLHYPRHGIVSGKF